VYWLWFESLITLELLLHIRYFYLQTFK
jgi:hypothetical protein